MKHATKTADVPAARKISTRRIPVAAKSSRQSNSVRHAAPRRARWKIPAVTPIGASAPVSETLPRAVKHIAENLNPDKIILFGSYAHGTPTPDSDVDLLVVMRTEASSSDRSWSVSRLLIPRPFPVDILVHTPHELSQAIKKGDFFLEDVLSQGKVLYERPRRSAGVD